MRLSEVELRKIIRKRILAEKAEKYKQGGGEIAGDLATAGIAGAATTYGVTGGLGALGATNLTLGAAAQLATAGGVANSTTAAIAAGYLSGGGAASGAAAAISGGPPGWVIGAGVAIGLGIAYILLDEGDVGSDIEGILNGTWAEKTNAELKKIETETKAKMKEAGMQDQLANFPSLTHYNDVLDLHTKMAKRLWRATKGGFFGMGTDEGEIETVIREMPSLMDLSLTASAFKQQYKKDLVKVFNEELSDEESLAFTNDMEDYVRKPIQDLKRKAVICFKDGNGQKACYSEKELIEFSNQVNELINNPPEPDDPTTQIVPINPNDLKGTTVQKIQFVMNKYSEERNLGMKITVDGKWGPQTDDLWGKVLNHSFTYHSVFKTLEYSKTYQSGFYPWTEVSGDMIGAFPGYVPRSIGCLAFVVDAYNGNTDYGSGNKKIKSGGGSGGRSRKRIPGNETISGSELTDTGFGLKPTVRVILAGQGKSSLESIGFKEGTTNGLVNAVSQRVKGNISGGTINLTIVTDRQGVVKNVRLAPGQRRSPVAKQFENLRNVVRRYLEKAGSADNEKIEPSRIRSKIRSKTRKFEIVLNFPAGRYN